MKILLTNHKLDTFGGSENWVLTQAQALLKLGHHVYIYTNKVGAMYNQLINIGCLPHFLGEYDLILCNHSTAIDKILSVNTNFKAPVNQTTFADDKQNEVIDPKEAFKNLRKQLRTKK